MEMKIEIENECIINVMKTMGARLSGSNLVNAVYAWAVSILKHKVAF